MPGNAKGVPSEGALSRCAKAGHDGCAIPRVRGEALQQLHQSGALARVGKQRLCKLQPAVVGVLQPGKRAYRPKGWAFRSQDLFNGATPHVGTGTKVRKDVNQ